MSYSIKVAQENASATETLLGVRLGRKCIESNVPVTTVAKALNVSKATVYFWFTGKRDVGKHLRERVESYYSSIPSQA